MLRLGKSCIHIVKWQQNYYIMMYEITHLKTIKESLSFYFAGSNKVDPQHLYFGYMLEFS
jgi:hypothetical protein